MAMEEKWEIEKMVNELSGGEVSESFERRTLAKYTEEKTI